MSKESLLFIFESQDGETRWIPVSWLVIPVLHGDIEPFSLWLAQKIYPLYSGHWKLLQVLVKQNFCCRTGTNTKNYGIGPFLFYNHFRIDWQMLWTHRYLNQLWSLLFLLISIFVNSYVSCIPFEFSIDKPHPIKFQSLVTTSKWAFSRNFSIPYSILMFFYPVKK